MFVPPPGLTEAQVVKSIDFIAVLLANTILIPGIDRDDVAQEVRLFCIEALPRYDPSRPLDNFLFRHGKNRLLNHRRKHYKRADGPCKKCRSGYPCGKDGRFCDRHRVWEKRQDQKFMVRHPAAIQSVDESSFACQSDSSSTLDDVSLREILTLIDTMLPVDLRADWLILRAGKSMEKARRVAVEAAIRGIIGEPAADATTAL